MRFMKYFRSSVVVMLLLISQGIRAEQPALAFNGASGFGKYTTGGNEGKVLVVSSLADNSKDPQEGTLRWAVKQPYPRLVVFAVSGVIQLEKTLEIKEPHITIAGHTSPAGIVVAGASTSIEADQVIIRHMAFRPGHFLQEGDALSARNHSDIIIDHCSLSWANDEVASFYNNTRFTLQNSIIAESLNNAGHHKGSHGYGGIWGGRDASFLRNVLVSHISRNPRINGWRLKSPYPQEDEFVDISNNVIVNWQDASGYGGEGGKANFTANYFLPGPATKSARFFEFWGDDRPLALLYASGNVMRDHPEMSASNALGIKVKGAKKNPQQAAAIKAASLADKPFRQGAISALKESTLTAQQAYVALIENANAGSFLRRGRKAHDSTDRRILAAIRSGSYAGKDGIIDSELEVTDWQQYRAELSSADTAETEELSAEQWRKLSL